MSLETLRPDVLINQSNLVGAVTDIDDDPDSPDGLWLTWDGSNSSQARVSVPTPSGNPNTGAGLQEFRALIRNATAGSNSTSWALEVYEDGTLVVEIATGSDPTEDSAGVVVSGTWDATLLGTADGSLVEIRLVQTAGATGNPGNQKGIEVGALEWNADVSGGGSSFDELPNMTGTGTPALSMLVNYARSLSIAATGAPALSRALSLSKDFSIAGAAGIAFANPAQHFRAHSFGGIGTVDEEHNIIVLVSSDMTGNAAVAFATQNFWDRQFNIGATGAPEISKQIAKILASAGLGSVSITKGIAIPRGYSGVGSVVALQEQSVLVEPDMTGTGTVVVSTQTAFGKALTYTGNAAVTIQKHIGKLFGFAGAGITSFFHDGEGGGPVGRLILRVVIRPMLRLILREK